MTSEIQDIAHFDRLIHEPARLAIMAVLSACESADFAYLLNATGVSKGNLSAHLSKLEEGGYVAIVKTFKGINDPQRNMILNSLVVKIVELADPGDFVKSEQAEVVQFLESQFITVRGEWEKKGL